MAKRLIISILALGLAVPAAGTAAVAPSAPSSSVAPSAPQAIQLAQQGPGVPHVGARVPGRPAVVGRPGLVGPGVGHPVGHVGVGRVVGPAVVGRPIVAPRMIGRPVVVGGPVFVRAYRPFYRRPWFGTVVGGIALGTFLTVAAVGVAPAAPPAPGLCWYWADPSLTQGYWDYCTAPY